MHLSYVQKCDCLAKCNLCPLVEVRHDRCSLGSYVVVAGGLPAVHAFQTGMNPVQTHHLPLCGQLTVDIEPRGVLHLGH